MKKFFTLIALFLSGLFLPRASAQVTCPDGWHISSSTNVEVGGIGVHVSLHSATQIDFNAGSASWKCHSDTKFFPVNALGLEAKTGPGNEDKFIMYYSNGSYNICQAVPYPLQGGCYHYHVLSRGQIDSISIPSGGITKVKGDDLYAIYGGMLAVKRNSAAHWGWDTAGLAPGGYVNDFDLDTFQNVYALSGGYLYYQTATGNTWTKVTSYPGSGGNNVSVDRRNRIIVGSSTSVYVSSDNGSTWVTGTPATGPGRFGTDAFGNIYTTGGSKAYRSTDGGATWTRIDQPITSHAMDSTLYPMITDISGDTLIYASTAWGIFVSADQGTTWAVANKDIQSSPYGYWLFNNSRQVANTDLGTFIKNATDTVWTQTYPTGGKYLKMGVIQGDTLGNIYTIMSMYSGQVQIPMKSTDQGATWQPDTAGLSSVIRPSLYAYYVDEYGGSHIAGYDSTGFNSGIYLVYSKTATGSYSLDTAGFGAQLPNFHNILTYCSDHRGHLYMCGHNYANLSVWRRPVTGGSWVPDTTGIGRGILTQSAYDNNGGVIGLDWVGNYLYHRNATGWKTMNYPSGVYSFSTPAGVTGNPSGGLISSFQLYSYTNNSFDYYGIYCTHDEGATWSYVPGLDSTGVNSAETFGDTTYLLTNIGIYKMTCNGTVINPTGVVTVHADDNTIRLYPNPVSGECHISMTDVLHESSTLLIQDLTGRVVKSIALTDHETTFRTDDMNAGLYVCTVTSGGKAIAAKKLVVE